MKKGSILFLLVLSLALSSCFAGKDGSDGVGGAKGDTGEGYLQPGYAYTDLGVARADLRTNEQCASCHGAGRSGDVKKVHEAMPFFYNYSGATINIALMDPAEAVKISYAVTITGVTDAAKPVVTFTVKDAKSNAAITGLAASTYVGFFRFTIAKLVPAASGSNSKWVNYTVTTDATGTAGQRPSTLTATTTELVETGTPGTYTYTWLRDLTLIQAQVNALSDSGDNRKADLDPTYLAYDNTAIHRVGMQMSGSISGTNIYAANAVYTYTPVSGVTSTARTITSIGQCNECHGRLAFHGGGRLDPNYCVLCHNGQRAYGRAQLTSASNVITADSTGNTYIVDGEVSGEMVTMIHKIHVGSNLAGTSLTKTGYNYAGVAFDQIKEFPMSPALCAKCHDIAISAEGDNWNTVPTRKACGACHDGVNWATGTGHTGGAATSDTGCVGCHSAASVKTYHMQVNKTANNGNTTPTGLSNFTYAISSVTVNSTTNDVTINFNIQKDGVNVTLATPAAGTVVPLTGFTGGPSFLLAYYLPGENQDGTTAVDYNNYGKTAAQPSSVSIASLLSTDNAATIGSISGTTGAYVATILGTATSAFPVGAKMRAVALQGYFTQSAVSEVTAGKDLNGDGDKTDTSVAVARHTVSAWKQVTGDAIRRNIVDPAKCANCHEWFEGHGGNRVYETQVCVMCHVPNLTTSGRTITDAQLAAYTFTAEELATLLMWDPNFSQTAAGTSLKFPEFTNNFKEMIHGFHAGGDREEPLRDVRNRTSVIVVMDAGSITFPGILNNCESCHRSNSTGLYSTSSPYALNSTTGAVTYDANLPSGVLPTTNVTLNATTPVTVTSKVAARTTVPNADDITTAPIVGTCISCHDSTAAKLHMNQNGGQLK